MIYVRSESASKLFVDADGKPVGRGLRQTVWFGSDGQVAKGFAWLDKSDRWPK